MIYPEPLKKGGRVAVISLSNGILGEPFCAHEQALGEKMLRFFGLEPVFTAHARAGLRYLAEHPEARAADLKAAFLDDSISGIICAIGGIETFRTIPYLMEDAEFCKAVREHPKFFLGYSDTTNNHMMFHRLGLQTFYGQAFLPDLCEIGPQMHPYTRKYFEELITTGRIAEIRPSDVWYEERRSFSPDQVGTPAVSHVNRGFELLQGSPVFRGKILGGCIDSLYDFFNEDRYADMPALCRKYQLFPDARDWKGRILLLESSEEKPSPTKYRKALECLKQTGVFDSVSGVLAGKPMDGAYEDEYKQLLVEVIGRPELPIVFNISIGHAMPRCIMPFGVSAVVDTEKQVIRFGN